MEEEDRGLLKWTVVLVSPMFGVISAACSTGRMGTVTTMVTGHVITVNNLLGTLMFYKKLEEAELQKLFMSLMIIGGNLTGACLGSWAAKRADTKVLLFPLPFLIYVLVWLHDHLARPRSLIKKMQKKLRNEESQDSASQASESESAL